MLTLPVPCWFALRLRSRCEFSVRAQLRDAAIEEFLPIWQQETRWSDRTNLTSRPLFTGYIFCRFDQSARVDVLRVRGVVQILGTEPIGDEEIANLRLFIAALGQSVPCPYVAGVRVRVERGPFAGVHGVVTRVKGAISLTIAVELLGRAVSVALDPADVEEIPCPSLKPC
jgi:transcriptional antiterminator RfaH